MKMLQDVTRCDMVLQPVLLCCFRLISSALRFPSGELGRAQMLFQSITHQAAVDAWEEERDGGSGDGQGTHQVL